MFLLESQMGQRMSCLALFVNVLMKYRLQLRGTSYCKTHHQLEKYRKRDLELKKRLEEEKNTETTKAAGTHKTYYPKTSTTKKVILLQKNLRKHTVQRRHKRVVETDKL